MAEHSAIEWTDATWNPVTGCTKVSPGCANCYISRTPPFRIGGRQFAKGHIPLQFHPDRLDAPLRKRKPTRYFVNSLSDLFHEDVPDTFIVQVFATIALAPQHTFQILTKRAARMRAWFERPGRAADVAVEVFKRFTVLREAERQSRNAVKVWPLRNVWLGVSVENQHFADERIPLLLQTPAAVRFISAEPLLGPVNLMSVPSRYQRTIRVNALNGGWDVPRNVPGEHRQEPRLHWVIVGGESGPGARPMHPDWARSLRDQCQAAGVPFFFKQWGEWAPGECAEGPPPSRTERTADYFNDWHFGSLTPRQSEELHCDDEPTLYRLGKKAAGRLLDGVAWDEFPEVAHAR